MKSKRGGKRKTETMESRRNDPDFAERMALGILVTGFEKYIVKAQRGGKREGAGRKPATDPAKHRGIRCTDSGWQWLKDQAKQAGASSVGKWADMKGKP